MEELTSLVTRAQAGDLDAYGTIVRQFQDMAYVLTMGPIPYDRSDGKTPDDPELDMKELHLPENEAMLFKALFPKLWPCSCPDPDVWPWVIGKEYPRYRHGDKEPPERKAQIDALRFPWIGY